MLSELMEQHVKTVIDDLSTIVYESQSVAYADANARCVGLSHHTYPHVRPHLLRALLREELLRASLPGQWKVAGTPQLSGQLLLVNPDMELRFLKERDTYPGGVPVAGHNKARRAWYQPSLPAVFPGDGNIVGGAMRYLFLWDYRDKQNLDAGFTLRLVHTTDSGTFGNRVPIDLSVPLLGDPGLAGKLHFTPYPEDEDFFYIADERLSEAN